MARNVTCITAGQARLCYKTVAVGRASVLSFETK
jgi:hypothetical protein